MHYRLTISLLLIFVLATSSVQAQETPTLDLATVSAIKLDDIPSPQDQARVRLLGVMRWAQEKYQRCLLDDPVAEPARKYLGSRKLSGKSVRDLSPTKNR